jgi:hypothetical protein
MITTTALGLVLVGCCLATSTPPRKYMLLDDRNVISSTASMVLAKVEKHAAGAMIKEERDYEMRFDNMQPNVWYDSHMKKWRAWYSAFTSCSKNKTEVPFCNNAPQKCGSKTNTSKNHGGRGTGLLYAESEDGITWTKPDLGITEWKGSKANNLIELEGMTTGIYLDETASVSERYKIVTGSNGKGAIAVSADGIRWNQTKDLEKQTYGRWDTPKNVVWDPVRKQWIIYIRSTPTEEHLRIQSYTHSLTDDFMGDYSPATPTGLNSSDDYQPDGLVVWPYEGIYLGIGNVFNPAQKPGAVAIGQVNMVLGWSPDARRWKWLVPGDSIIPLGAAGEFDSCGVFGAKQDPLRTVAANDTLRLYYTGCNGPFFGSRGCGLGMATLQRDFFAGYRGGTVVTAPVRVEGKALKVSVDGGNLGVQVGIVGSDAFSVESCDVIMGKKTDWTVSWRGSSDLSKYVNGAVSLEFKIPVDATAFAFSFGEPTALVV